MYLWHPWVLIFPFSTEGRQCIFSTSCIHVYSLRWATYYTSCKSHPHTAKFPLLLTGWRRRSPSGRRCGPWRGRRPLSSRRGGCIDTRWGCSTVGCRPGSWGRCEHCQEQQQTYKDMHMISYDSFSHSWVHCTSIFFPHMNTSLLFIHLTFYVLNLHTYL